MKKALQHRKGNLQQFKGKWEMIMMTARLFCVISGTIIFPLNRLVLKWTYVYSTQLSIHFDTYPNKFLNTSAQYQLIASRQDRGYAEIVILKSSLNIDFIFALFCGQTPIISICICFLSCLHKSLTTPHLMTFHIWL